MVDADRYSEDDLMPPSTPARRTSRSTTTSTRWSTEPADLTAVREALEAAGVELESAELVDAAQHPRRRSRRIVAGSSCG